MKLEADRGGEGDRLLLLLHGLGATRHVWHPMLASVGDRWQGTWIAPDLRGHGASPRGKSYAFGAHAADIGELTLAAGNWREIVIVGHSMGGVISLGLASGWFGLKPSHAFGLGIKVAWSADEQAKLVELAAAPVRWLASEEDALTRYSKASGLSGLIALDSPAAKAGIARGDNGWRLAADPATFSVGAPPMKALAAAAQGPLHLARGESDRMMTLDQLRTFDGDAIDIKGAGHYAMIDNPAAVWAWIESKRG